MITLKQGMQLSAIVDKLELKPKFSEMDAKGNRVQVSQEAMGTDLMVQALSKAHRAEKEIYAFVAEVKGCSPKEAQDVNLFEFVREIVENAEMRDFFSATAESQAQN